LLSRSLNSGSLDRRRRGLCRCGRALPWGLLRSGRKRLTDVGRLARSCICLPRFIPTLHRCVVVGSRLRRWRNWPCVSGLRRRRLRGSGRSRRRRGDRLARFGDRWFGGGRRRLRFAVDGRWRARKREIPDLGRADLRVRLRLGLQRRCWRGERHSAERGQSGGMKLKPQAGNPSCGDDLCRWGGATSGDGAPRPSSISLTSATPLRKPRRRPCKCASAVLHR
jgi:hypothetical protein